MNSDQLSSLYNQFMILLIKRRKRWHLKQAFELENISWIKSKSELIATDCNIFQIASKTIVSVCCKHKKNGLFTLISRMSCVMSHRFIFLNICFMVERFFFRLCPASVSSFSQHLITDWERTKNELYRMISNVY